MLSRVDAPPPGGRVFEMLVPSKFRRCVQARSVWKTLNYPVFIPEGDPELIALLVSGDAAKLESVLKRRASLGSGSAAALLGFLELMRVSSGEQNPEAAIAWCIAPSKAGDPYAQYVLSWAYWEARKGPDALSWMQRSAVDSKFLPARVDAGRMLAMVAGNAAEARDAVKVLWVAHKLGHAAALVLICKIALNRQLGPIACLLGIMLFPYAALRFALIVRCDPFAARAFSYIPNAKRPLFEPVQALSPSYGKLGWRDGKSGKSSVER